MGSVVWTGPFCLPTMMTHRETVEMFKTRNRAPHRTTAPQSLSRLKSRHSSIRSPMHSRSLRPPCLPPSGALSFSLRLISSPTLFLLRLIAATDATPTTRPRASSAPAPISISFPLFSATFALAAFSSSPRCRFALVVPTRDRCPRHHCIPRQRRMRG